MRKRAWLRWPLVAWIMLLPVMLGGIVAVKELGRRERAALADFNAAEKASWSLGQKQRDWIKSLYARHRRTREPGSGWTRHDVQREVPGAAGGTLSETRGANGQVRESLLFFDPLSYWRFELSFDDNRWTGYSIGGGSAPASMRPGANPTLRGWMRIRKTLLLAASLLWLALLGTAIVWRKSAAGAHLFHGSLLVAFVILGIGEAHPFYTFSLSSDQLWMGVVAIAISVAFLIDTHRAAVQRRRRQVADRICLECGYDLRATPERCPECGTPVPSWVM